MKDCFYLFLFEDPLFLYVVAQEHDYNLQHNLHNGGYCRRTNAKQENQGCEAHNRHKGLHKAQTVILQHSLQVIFLASENIEGVHIEVKY